MKNRLKTLLVLSMAAALCCCSTDDAPDESSSEEWKISVSRSEGEGGESNAFTEAATIFGYNTAISSTATAYIQDDYENNQWKGDKHTWGDTQATLNLVAVSPTVTSLPITIQHGGEAYLMAYLHQASKKNASFTLNHVMAQLQIHIKVNSDENPKPSSLSVMLYPAATLQFNDNSTVGSTTNGCVRDSQTFTVNDNKDANDVWQTEVVNVVPQTIPSGQVALRFWINNTKEYTFTPTEAIEITAGKITHIYLGVAYDDIKVTLSGVSVSNWGEGAAINGGEAQEK